MQPLLLNVDWLGLTVAYHSQDWRSLDERHSFVEFDGTNTYRGRRVVYNEFGEKVATILFDPKSGLIKSHFGLIEIANEWLYHGKSPQRILAMLNDWRPFDIVGISRADLCVDYNPTEQQREVAAMLASGECYVGGKRSGSLFWSHVDCRLLADVYQGKRICHCQSWGHKTTAVKWKLYYKSKELADDLGGKMFAKPYILDCWHEAGLDERDVWRLEVSIKHGNQLHFRGEPLTYTVLHKFPTELFKALYTERFKVSRAEGHKDRTNDERVEFLPVGAASGIRVAPPAATTTRNGRITLLRHLVQSLESEEVLLDDDSREGVLEHVQAIVERDGLLEYFHVMVSMDLYTWVEAMRCKAYTTLETHRIPERKSLWDIMEEGRKFEIGENSI